MAYCSQTDLETARTEQVIIDLTDDAKTGSVNVTNVNWAILQAGKEIDSYIFKRYTVPVDVSGGIPAALNRIAIKLATCYLYERRSAEFGFPENIQKMKDEAISELKEIRSGLQELGIEPPPAKSSVMVADSDGLDPVFTGGSDGSLRRFGE